jgi:hypothetical protein
LLYIGKDSNKPEGRERERDKSHKRAAVMPKYETEENLSPGRNVPGEGRAVPHRLMVLNVKTY